DALTACAPIEIRIGDVKCWGEPSAGIYLSVEDPTGSVARIRQVLAIVEPPGLEYVPHITLMHQRTTDAARNRAAWEHLATWRLDQHVLIDAVAVIELRGSTWETTGSVRLSR
ncbi:MAG: hypothetical protein EHM57_06510, partial [Actinobacteria bacterium]